MENQINFNNLENAFVYKKNGELRFTYFMFRLLQNPRMVKGLGAIAAAVLKFNMPVKQLIKKTIFRVFCSGENIGEAISSIRALSRYKVSAVLDYVSEGEKSAEAFSRNEKIILANIHKLAKEAPGNSISIKLSGLEDPAFFVRVNNLKNPQTPQDEHRYKILMRRLETLSEAAAEQGLIVYIDAEDRNMQDVFDQIVEQLMEKYNKKKAVIYNTLQMYLIDRLAYLQQLLEDSKTKNYFPGIKLVRGAYAEKERERANQLHVPSPVFDYKDQTDLSFNKAVELCLRNHQRVYTCIASHNQYSTEFAVKCIEVFAIKDHHEKVKFSQLYGMSDHLTFNLASSGFNASKYMPYGEVKKAIPYLIRRAEENSSINKQVSEEVGRLRKELFRRKLKNKESVLSEINTL